MKSHILRPLWTIALVGAIGLGFSHEVCAATSHLVGASAPTTPAQVQLNFREAPLDAVLKYLSDTVGLIIVRETSVDGVFTVVSYKPLAADEAIALLNTALHERGYAAIRNGRTLTIVKREDAKKRNIPVKVGAKPEAIPRTDEMVTQIIPVPHANAAQLLENLQPLLPVYAVATVNESSNAIILTDTQANIRRMVEIVRGLDISITSGADVKVYRLQLSKAADFAKVVTSLFPAASNAQGGQSGQGEFRMGPPMPGPDGPDMAGATTTGGQASTPKVTAVADERSNSVVVSGPKGVLLVIDALVAQLDRIAQSGIEVRVFSLKNANADETASLINDMFTASASAKTDSGQGDLVFAGGPFGPPPMGGPGEETSGAQVSSSEKTIHAVSDYRTNSVIVTAESGRMSAVEQLVTRLDASPARQQKVYVYSLKNATAADLATIVQGVISQNGTSSSQTRVQNASSQTQSTQSSSSGSALGSGGDSPMQGGGPGGM